MKATILATVTAAGLVLAGCATIVSGSSEDIAVLTPPVSGATCVLSNGQGSWTVVTPTVAHVQRDLGDLQVKCTKAGYQVAWTNLPSNWNGWALANIANLGVGMGVDSYTGAIDEYPHSVQLTMQPDMPAQGQSPVPPGATASPTN